MELLLIRHARPQSLYASSGQPDPELDAEGLQQAEALAVALAHEEIDAIHCSSMARARQTAAPLARAHALEVHLHDDLVEITFGEDRYVPISSRGPHSPSQKQVVEDWQTRLRSAEGRETIRRFRSRVQGALGKIVAAEQARTVAVVCHGGVINAALTAALDIDQLMTFDPDYASVSRLLIGRSGRMRVTSVNEHAHVRALERTIS